VSYDPTSLLDTRLAKVPELRYAFGFHSCFTTSGEALYEQMRELYKKTGTKNGKFLLAWTVEFVDALPADQHATYAIQAYLLIVKCHLTYKGQGGGYAAASDDELVNFLLSREIMTDGLNGDALKKTAMTGRCRDVKV
jgi:hypothetical protein